LCVCMCIQSNEIWRVGRQDFKESEREEVSSCHGECERDDTSESDSLAGKVRFKIPLPSAVYKYQKYYQS